MSDPKPSVLESLRASVVPPRTQAEAQAPAPRALSGARRKCSFDLPVELADDLRVLCALQGTRQREVIEALVTSYVREHRQLLPRSRSA